MNPKGAKDDDGKLKIMWVPPQIIRDIAEVREYGNKKYGDPENWRTVGVERYFNALLRHTLLFMEDPYGKDAESGIEHYKHMACNMAFICQLIEDNKHIKPAEASFNYIEDIEDMDSFISEGLKWLK